MKLLVMILAVLVSLQDAVFAGDDELFDVLEELDIQRDNEAGTQNLTNSKVYAAKVSMELADGNGDNDDFTNDDLMRSLTLRSRAGRLDFPAGNRDAIEDFAKRNAKRILEILFPGGFGSNTIGRSESQYSSSLTFDEIVTPLFDLDDSTGLGETTGEPTPPASGQPVIQLRDSRNDLSGRVEFSTLDINKDDGYSVGGLLSYQRRFGEGFRLGVLLPYRYTSLDDSIDTTAHFVQINPFAKYTLYDGLVKVNVGGDGYVSSLLGRSDAIKYFGNLTYGGGGFTSIEKRFSHFYLSGGIGFKVSKRTVGFSRNKDDFVDRVIDAINDRALDKDLTYGLNLGIPYRERFILNVGAHRTSSFGADVPDDSDSQTKLRVVGQYRVSPRFELNGGYSTILELKDVTDHIFFLSALGRF